jgi:hypothetical protein
MEQTNVARTDVARTDVARTDVAPPPPPEPESLFLLPDPWTWSWYDDEPLHLLRMQAVLPFLSFEFRDLLPLLTAYCVPGIRVRLIPNEHNGRHEYGFAFQHFVATNQLTIERCIDNFSPAHMLGHGRDGSKLTSRSRVR